MFDQARSIIAATLAVVVVLVILWVVGVLFGPKGTNGLPAVGVGIAEIIKGIGKIFTGYKSA